MSFPDKKQFRRPMQATVRHADLCGREEQFPFVIFKDNVQKWCGEKFGWTTVKKADQADRERIPTVV